MSALTCLGAPSCPGLTQRLGRVLGLLQEEDLGPREDGSIAAEVTQL